MRSISLLHRKSNSNGCEKLVNISKAVETLDRVVLKSLLVIHPWGGQDTKSAVHGKGKASIICLFHKIKRFRKHVSFI